MMNQCRSWPNMIHHDGSLSIMIHNGQKWSIMIDYGKDVEILRKYVNTWQNTPRYTEFHAEAGSDD